MARLAGCQQKKSCSLKLFNLTSDMYFGCMNSFVALIMLY